MLAYCWTFMVLFTSVSSQLIIQHNDDENTETEILQEGNLQVVTQQKNVGEWLKYQYKTGVKVSVLQPLKETNDDQILYQSKTKDSNNNFYQYSYSTSKGTSKNEIVTILDAKNKASNPIIQITGYYTYIGDDGIRYIFSYVADEKGYQPKVLFGKDVEILEVTDKPILAASPPVEIDGAVLCSLLGRGCI